MYCSQETGTFFELFESVCAEDFCGILLKKIDKKKERQVTYVELMYT